MIGRNKIRQGFTLIEMLIVIMIVALLLAIMLIGGTAYQRRARNGERKSDMTKFKSGMENFYSQNKFYPNPGENVALPGTGILPEYPKCSASNDISISGFKKVNQCLNFLGYMDKLDQNLTADDRDLLYHFAIKEDAITWEASAKMEDAGGADGSRYEVGQNIDQIDSSGNSYPFAGYPSGVSTTD